MTDADIAKKCRKELRSCHTGLKASERAGLACCECRFYRAVLLRVARKRKAK